MSRLLPLMLLVAACSGGAVETTTTVEASATTAAAPVSTTSTTVVESTTTTEAVKQDDICRGSSTFWEPGRTYAAECYLVPVAFEVSTVGWRSRGATEDTIFVSWKDPDDDAFVVNLGLAIGRSTGELLSEIQAATEKVGIVLLGPVAETTVAGREAFVAVLDGEPIPEDQRPASGGAECLETNRAVLHFRRESYPIAGPFVSLGGEFFGVGACRRVSVWVFQPGEHTVTAVGGTVDPARHSEAVAKIEELFEGMSFDVGGGS